MDVHSVSAPVVVGNENGVVGHGLGRPKEGSHYQREPEDAEKPDQGSGEIPHDPGPKKVRLKVDQTCRPWYRCNCRRQHARCTVLKQPVLRDVLAKNLGSANPHNVVKATFQGIALLREPVDVSNAAMGFNSMAKRIIIGGLMFCTAGRIQPYYYEKKDQK